MKRFSKLLVVALAFVFALTLTACGKKDDYKDYIGYQFSGKDPWGNEIAVTIRTLENDTLTWSYTDVLNDNDAITLYNEVSSAFKDGSGSFTVNGDADKEGYSFNYSGTISLKDGNVVIVYENGQLTSNSSEGGSTSHNVAALEDNAKTITLTKVVDNS